MQPVAEDYVVWPHGGPDQRGMQHMVGDADREHQAADAVGLFGLAVEDVVDGLSPAMLRVRNPGATSAQTRKLP